MDVVHNIGPAKRINIDLNLHAQAQVQEFSVNTSGSKMSESRGL